MLRNTTTELLEIRVHFIQLEQISFLEKYGCPRALLQFGGRDPKKEGDDRNSTAPRRAKLCPNVRPVECPWREQHHQLMRTFQKIENVFLKVRAGINLGFVKDGFAPRASISRAICRATQVSCEL